MADLIRWLGYATDTTAKLVVRSDTSGVITLSGVDSDSPKTADTAVDDGIVTFTATGLSANASYPVTITHADASTETITLKTMPVSGSTYKFGWGSCNSNYTEVAAAYPLVDLNIVGFAHLGDLIYSNGGNDAFGEVSVDGDTDQTTANYNTYHRQSHRNTGIKHLAENTPFYFMADDHEWHGDNWDNTATQATKQGATHATQASVDAAWSTENAARVSYSLGNPSNSDTEAVAEKPSDHERSSLADHGVITASASNYPVMYCRWTIGDAEFFLLDTITYRSALASTDNASKTLLGANQKAWLKAKLLASTATFKIILTPKKLYATTGADNTDTWTKYTTERTELLAYIDSNQITTVAWLAGDRHTPEVEATSKKEGNTYDSVCICACPLAVGINPIQGTHGSTTKLLQPEFGQIFGLLEVHGSDYILLQLRSSYTGAIKWEGKMLAGSNTLTYANDNDYDNKLVVAIGDSLVGGLNEWDEQLDAMVLAKITDKGTGGDTIADANNVGNSVEYRFNDDVIVYGADEVIVCAGINDIISASVGVSPIANMQQAATDLLTTATNAGITVSFMNVSPFGNHTSYSAEREGYRGEWNTWILSFCQSNNITHYDISTVLADPGTPVNVLAAYDNGDGLHPNTTGAGAIADYVFSISKTSLNTLSKDTMSVSI